MSESILTRRTFIGSIVAAVPALRCLAAFAAPDAMEGTAMLLVNSIRGPQAIFHFSRYLSGRLGIEFNGVQMTEVRDGEYIAWANGAIAEMRLIPERKLASPEIDMDDTRDVHIDWFRVTEPNPVFTGAAGNGDMADNRNWKYGRAPRDGDSIYV